jgi:TolA-binding protein
VQVARLQAQVQELQQVVQSQQKKLENQADIYERIKQRALTKPKPARSTSELALKPN